MTEKNTEGNDPMKKYIFFLLCAAVLLFSGCMPALPPREPSAPVSEGTEITVIIGEMTAGADVSDVFAGIELNGEGAACRIDRWYYDESDKARPIVITAPIPENYRGYYDVGFYLPEGVALADAVITVDAPNCTSYEIGEGEFSSETQTDVLVRVYFDLSK